MRSRGDLPFPHERRRQLVRLMKAAANDVRGVHGDFPEHRTRNFDLAALAELISEKLLRNKREAKGFIELIAMYSFGADRIDEDFLDSLKGL